MDNIADRARPDLPLARQSVGVSPMPRRAFLASLGCAALIAALPQIGDLIGATPIAGTVCDMWRDLSPLRAIGRRYLAMAPGEADRAYLPDLLFGDGVGLPDMSVAAVRGHIAASRDRDFAAGDTVVIDGWVLARTEARLCALCTLA